MVERQQLAAVGRQRRNIAAPDGGIDPKRVRSFKYNIGTLT
jgi:hypothetical protein